MAELVIQSEQLRALYRRLEKAGKQAQRRDLLEDLAGVLEAQTKRRIADEKTDPDGTPWRPWSDAYRKTRKSHHSLLVSSGSLRDDIAAEVSGRASVVVFSSLVYAAKQNDTRPFLGISSDNERELVQVATEYLAALL